MAREGKQDLASSGILIEPDERSQIPFVKDDEIPDGGYGWINVLAVFIMNAFTWGATAVSTARSRALRHKLIPPRQSFGVFLGIEILLKAWCGMWLTGDIRLLPVK